VTVVGKNNKYGLHSFKGGKERRILLMDSEPARVWMANEEGGEIMISLKCDKCGLVNYAGQETCKRCGTVLPIRQEKPKLEYTLLRSLTHLPGDDSKVLGGRMTMKLRPV
jgi:hypothetical protein